MSPNDVFALIVEAVFAVVFAGALVEYVRRRNPINRDVALAFSPFVGLLVLALMRLTVGPPPTILATVLGLLFFAQPVFALHLVALIRPVPRAVQVGALVAIVVSLVPTLLIRPAIPGLALLALAVFTGIQLITAGYLVLEARRRRGPGGQRLRIAAAATVGLAAALLLVTGGSAAVGGQSLLSVALAVALLSGIGYVVAFVPPTFIRHIWQAGATVDYQRDLLARSGAEVDAIWAGYATLATEVTGAACAVVEDDGEGSARVVAHAGFDGAPPPDRVSLHDSEASRYRLDIPVRSLDVADPIRQVADVVGATYVSVVDIADASARSRRRSLIVAGSYRTLFHESDLELLSALGSQTGFIAERRSMVADQEALSARLANTVDALREAARAKSDFLASMSHELRTPLSAILGFSDLMRQEPRDGDSLAVPAEWVEHIHRGGNHLLALVNDVLDLSKVEAGRMELVLEEIDLSSAVIELANGVRPLADRKGLRLETDVPSMPVVADRGRLRQILYNLVSNAIKFTPADGRVAISAEASDDGYTFTVSDTGVGIAAADLPMIFEEFRQVGSEDAREGGTGLGLALAQRLVGAHGGRIDVESTVGEGTTFTVTMPRLATPGRTVITAPLRPAVDDQAAGRDVLVIEDDPSAVRLLREYLEPAGYVLRHAANGEQGLAMAREQRPAAVLLDVLVPRLDGWEVLRRLKADPTMDGVPVVMVTVVDEREVGLALGAVDYLVKPVQRDALLACLSRLGLDTASPGRPSTILTVDDEPAALDLIDGYLAGSGIDIVRADGGRAAVDIARERDIDLVICDLLMPDLDGFGVVAELKADASTASIPILICTAHDLSPEEKTRLHGQILGIVSKGPTARDGLHGWLSRVRLAPRSASA
jgi:signal transduction histidine kinase/DNA-binding response OmpR family regulator